MPDKPPSFYKMHLFFCTQIVNDPRCCGKKGGEELFLHLRRTAHTHGLTWQQFAITKTGCMGRCMSGPSLVIYPDNIWYAPRTLTDIEMIVTEHLLNGRIVESLLMPQEEPVLEGYPPAIPSPRCPD